MKIQTKIATLNLTMKIHHLKQKFVVKKIENNFHKFQYFFKVIVLPNVNNTLLLVFWHI
jgi:hypothetical protein